MIVMFLQWDMISVAIMALEEGDATSEEVNKLKESIVNNLHTPNLYQILSFSKFRLMLTSLVP